MKNQPTWLRGGLYALLLGYVLLAIVLVSQFTPFGIWFISDGSVLISFFELAHFFGGGWLTTFITGTILLFIIGVIIGLTVRNPRYRKLAIVAWILILIIVLGISVNRQRYPYYDNYTLEQCHALTNAWYKSAHASKERCFQVVAEQQQNVSICDNFPSGDQRDFCIEKIAQEKKDSSLCALMTGIRKENCYSWFDQCEKVSDVSRRDGCYEHVSINQYKENLCAKISTEHGRDICYRNVAPHRNDQGLCALIKTFYLRDECNYYFKNQ